MQSFLGLRPVQKEAIPSHTLQDNAFENPFGFNKDNPSQRNCQNHMVQECQESLIQGNIYIQ